MIDFNIYTVAHGDRFIKCAIDSAESFVKHNENIRYTIFILMKETTGINPLDFAYYKEQNIHIKITHDWKSFSPEFIKKKPFADICLFKSAIAPGLLTEPSKYIGFVDADTICNRRLPFEFIKDKLDHDYICVATDSKAYQRKHELNIYFSQWELYFNSGVIFYSEDVKSVLISKFYKWCLKNQNVIINYPFNEQTWLNIFLNNRYPEILYELGYYWNMRSSVNVKEAHIWHYGRKVAEAGSYE